MSLAAQEKTCTIDDIYALPEGERAELIDGQIYYMAPPARKHQRIAGELYATIRELQWRAGLDYRNRFAEQQTDGLLYQAIQIPHCWRAGILDRGS